MLRTPTLVSCEILPFRAHNMPYSDLYRLSDSGERKFLEARVITARHLSTKPSLLIYIY